MLTICDLEALKIIHGSKGNGYFLIFCWEQPEFFGEESNYNVTQLPTHCFIDRIGFLVGSKNILPTVLVHIHLNILILTKKNWCESWKSIILHTNSLLTSDVMTGFSFWPFGSKTIFTVSSRTFDWRTNCKISSESIIVSILSKMWTTQPFTSCNWNDSTAVHEQ